VATRRDVRLFLFNRYHSPPHEGDSLLQKVVTLAVGSDKITVDCQSSCMTSFHVFRSNSNVFLLRLTRVYSFNCHDLWNTSSCAEIWLKKRSPTPVAGKLNSLLTYAELRTRRIWSIRSFKEVLSRDWLLLDTCAILVSSFNSPRAGLEPVFVFVCCQLFSEFQAQFLDFIVNALFAFHDATSSFSRLLDFIFPKVWVQFFAFTVLFVFIKQSNSH